MNTTEPDVIVEKRKYLYDLGCTTLLFVLIRLFSGHPVPDAAKLVFYRPDFYGARAKDFTQEAMRGPSAWSVGDRELMAAYVSKVNESTFCIGARQWVTLALRGAFVPAAGLGRRGVGAAGDRAAVAR